MDRVSGTVNMRSGEGPYQTLGIAPYATVEEIKHAYRQAALAWHPDVARADPAESQRRFRLVTDAYRQALRDALPAARKNREACQAPGPSGTRGHSRPHEDHRLYTPPTPPSRQDGAESPRPRRRSRLRRDLRFLWRESRIPMLGIVWCLSLLFVVTIVLGVMIVRVVDIASIVIVLGGTTLLWRIPGLIKRLDRS